MSKRQDILDAAEAAFETSGFHAVPVDEIIGRAAVSPRTLYAHFPSKTDLAEAVLSARNERFVAAMSDGATSSDDPVEGLFDALEHWLGQATGTGCLFLRALGEYGSEPITPVVLSHKAAFHELLESIARSCGQPLAFAHSLFLLAEGATAVAPSHGVATAVGAARAAARRLRQ